MIIRADVADVELLGWNLNTERVFNTCPKPYFKNNWHVYLAFSYTVNECVKSQIYKKVYTTVSRSVRETNILSKCRRKIHDYTWDNFSKITKP